MTPPNDQPLSEELHEALGALRTVLDHARPGEPMSSGVFEQVATTAEKLSHVLDSANGNGVPQWLLTCEACGDEFDDFRGLKDHRGRAHGLRAIPPQIGRSVDPTPRAPRP